MTVDIGRRLTDESVKGLDSISSSLSPMGTKSPTDVVNLNKLAKEIREAKNHYIQWKKTGRQLNAKLIESDGKFAKYWLLNAKDTNGNGWGVTNQSIAKNIQSFVGRPFVITSNAWIVNSAYGKTFDHPFIPSNNIKTILGHQARYRVGKIISIDERNGEYFAIIQMDARYAHINLPAFCSPAIYQLNASESDTALSTWTALHLAGLDENPAYGARVALLRGTCHGTSGQCVHQLKTAKLLQAVRGPEPTSRFAPGTPLKKEVPFGPTTQQEDNEDLDLRVKVEERRGTMRSDQRILPGTPTQRDRERIIQAKLDLVKLAGRFDIKPTRIQQVTPFKIEKTKINKFTGKPQKFIQFTPEEAAFIEGDVNKIRPRKQDFPSDLKKRLAVMSKERFRKFKEKEDRRIGDSMSDAELNQADDIFRQMADKPPRIKSTTDVKKKLAALRSQSNEAVNRINVAGTDELSPYSKAAIITKGNTTFDPLEPEEITSIEDIELNIKPIPGTAGRPSRKRMKTRMGPSPSRTASIFDEDVFAGIGTRGRRPKSKAETGQVRRRQSEILKSMKTAVKIRADKPKERPPSFDEVGSPIPKNKGQSGQIRRNQERIRKEMGLKKAKGINCACGKLKVMKASLQLQKMAKLSKSERIVRNWQTFKRRNPRAKVTNGVFDSERGNILDGNRSGDGNRLQAIYGTRDKKRIGFNSITDTRKGPNKSLVRVQRELSKIEKAGGMPALGFDEGSLEAVDVTRGISDKDIVKKLAPHQKTTGVYNPLGRQGKRFRIVKNPKFEGN